MSALRQIVTEDLRNKTFIKISLCEKTLKLSGCAEVVHLHVVMSCEKFRVRNRIIYKSADDCFFCHLVDDKNNKVLKNENESWQLVTRNPFKVPDIEVIDAVREFINKKKLPINFIVDPDNQNSPEVVHELFDALKIPLKIVSRSFHASDDGSFNRLAWHGDLKFRVLELCKKNVQALESMSRKNLVDRICLDHAIIFSENFFFNY